METDGFWYTVTHTLPQCNSEHNKRWRMRWTVCFHLFWEGVELVRLKVQVILVHINKKWFYDSLFECTISLCQSWDALR